MRVVRFLDAAGAIQYGAEESDGSARLISGDIFGAFEITAVRAEIATRLAPIAPAAILCIGLNYRHHAEETSAKIPDYPILFVKSANAVQHPGAPIEIPTHLKSEQVDYECELAVVIGRKCKNVARAKALDYVLGYTCGNDVSARDWQIQRGREPMVPREDVRHLCPAWPVSCNRR